MWTLGKIMSLKVTSYTDREPRHRKSGTVPVHGQAGLRPQVSWICAKESPSWMAHSPY
jgi:hypothetical protein